MSANRQERSGKVQTVLGAVDAEHLGITLTHEHHASGNPKRLLQFP